MAPLCGEASGRHHWTGEEGGRAGRAERRTEVVRRAGRAAWRAGGAGGGPSPALGEGARVPAWGRSVVRFEVGAIGQGGGRARGERREGARGGRRGARGLCGARLGRVGVPPRRSGRARGSRRGLQVGASSCRPGRLPVGMEGGRRDGATAGSWSSSCRPAPLLVGPDVGQPAR